MNRKRPVGQEHSRKRIAAGFTLVVLSCMLGLVVAGTSWGATTKKPPPRPTPPPPGPAVNLYSMYGTTLLSGAQAYWSAGFTGKGVDVALIDTGVAPVDGLSTSGKVIDGPDLSFESQAPKLRYRDTYGHGTHMAGIIAGRGSGAVADAYAGDTAHFLGMAPDARIVSLKVGDAHGAADVSQVIAAIAWVVQHRNDRGMNIRVLNLSYGTNSAQPYQQDPLAYAVEQAWKAGIFVVVAAGNDGFATQSTMNNPAVDPHVLAVGATDPNGTLARGDDTVPSFSSSGSHAGAHATGRYVDLAAPGSHIESLRVPGSYADLTYGSTGLVGPQLFRGSGTSQAAAVVSGAAALVIQQRPNITPTQLKALLMNTAESINAQRTSQGKGELNLQAALTATVPTTSSGSAWSNGTGTLEASRGSVHLVKDGVTLQGERDIFGKPFSAAAMAAAEATASSWSGGTWNGSTWSGSSWSGSSWSASSWSGSSWSGSSWSASSWSANSWSGSSWSGSSWSANNWLGGNLAGNTWSSASWS